MRSGSNDPADKAARRAGNRVVEMVAIRKRFGSLTANDAVDLDLHDGEIHALLGENGAGKSTLMNILSGMLRPDSGEIRVDGQTQQFRSPRDAMACGIAMVHQHHLLVPELTVAENVILGRRDRRLINPAGVAREITDFAAKLGLPVDGAKSVDELSVGMRQRVEILKALYRHPRILILDEPTAVLTPPEIKEFLGNLRDLRSHGTSIVLITHHLEEVLEGGDWVTVLRDGRVVGSQPARGATAAELSFLMVGRDLKSVVATKGGAATQPVLEVTAVTALEKGRALLSDVSFELASGEIVAVVGVEGNGQLELAEVVTGLRKLDSGSLAVEGLTVTRPTPRRMSQLGVAYVPSDRQNAGLVLDFTIAENLVLDRYWRSPIATGFWLSRRRIQQRAELLLRDHGLQALDARRKARELSGGNQQKIVLIREVSRNPVLLVAVNPTRGLDVGASEYIHHLLVARAAAGMGVLLITSDLTEAMALANRICVMYRGRIASIVDPTAGLERIGMLMSGVSSDDAPNGSVI